MRNCGGFAGWLLFIVGDIETGIFDIFLRSRAGPNTTLRVVANLDLDLLCRLAVGQFRGVPRVIRSPF